MSFNSSNLLTQTITDQYSESFDTDEDGVDDTDYLLRDVSDNAIDWGSHMGWKIDLMPTNIEGSANAGNFGERQVSNAIVRSGRVIFTTLIPSQVECEFGGTSFLMELDFRSGGALEFPAFDLNGDGELNFFDVSVFLGAFAVQDPVADIDGDGQYSFFDVSAFLQAFTIGCP